MLFVVHKTIVIKTGPSIKWVRGTFPNSVGSTVDSLLYYTKNNMWTNSFLLLCKLTTSPLLLCKPPHRPYNDELRRTSLPFPPPSVVLSSTMQRLWRIKILLHRRIRLLFLFQIQRRLRRILLRWRTDSSLDDESFSNDDEFDPSYDKSPYNQTN